MLLKSRRAVVLLGALSSMQGFHGAMANPLDARQEEPSAVSSIASQASPTASPTAPPASAAASGLSLPSETGSIASKTILSGTRTPSASASKGATASSTTSAPGVVIFIDTGPPDFTATSSSAWHALGINATVTSTWTYTGTNTASSATKISAGYVVTSDENNKTIADYKEDFVACRINGTIEHQSPFCTPEHDQELWVGKIYAATWNPELFKPNATNYIEIHDANSTSSETPVYKTEEVHNLKGYINIHMLNDFLRGHAGKDTDTASNLTFHLISTPLGGEANKTIGPIIHLTLDPDTLPKLPIPDMVPKKLGFQIGLPIGLVASILIGLSIWCAIRKNKRRWREVRHHGSDYIKKRTGKRRATKAQNIELSDYDFDSSTARAERFEDEPTRGGGNAFRDEIERQKQEEWRNRPQKITSF